MSRCVRPALRLAAMLLLLHGCGGEPSQTANAPAAASEAQAPDPAPQKSSPLESARDALGQDLGGDAPLDGLLDAAKAARAWASVHASAPEVGEALLIAAQLELTAIGAAAARDGAKRATSAGFHDFETRLRGMAKLPETLGESHSEYQAARRVAEAGLVALSTNPNVKDVMLDLGSARALALSATHEGLIIRALWMSRIESALAALSNDPPELHVSTAIPLVGRLLCNRCADAHHITPDKVTHFLLNPSNSGGMICDTALQVGRTAKTPPMEIAAMSSCEKLRLSKGAFEPTLLWGTNAILVGALHLATELAAAPPGDGTMSPLIEIQAKRLSEMLGKAIRLPVLVPSAPVADGNLEAAWNASLEDIKSGGPSVDRSSDGIVYVGPDGVRVGLRPTVAIEKDVLVSRSAERGLPAAGKSVMSLQDLDRAEVDPERGIAAISSAVTELRRGVKSMGGVETAPIELVVDARARASSVTKVLDAMRVAGVHHVRFAKTASHGYTLPLLVREEAPGLKSRFGEREGRPYMAVVSDSHVDVWLPRGVKGKKTGDIGKFAKGLGDNIRVGYKGAKVTRLRVPLGLDASVGIGVTGSKALDQVFRAAADRLDVGQVLHVVGRKGARAADILAVSSIFQERPGRALDKPETIWPGAACGGGAYTRIKRTPKGCATAVAIAFSSKIPPFNSGITESPNKDAKKAEAPQKPGAGFCDKKDIAANMKRRRGSFRFCYERELRMNKDLAGKVTMRFSIGASGAVQGTPRVASSTMNNKALHSCLTKNIQKITFGKPDGGTCSVRWPFVFGSKQ